MNNLIDIYNERGFIEQTTHAAELEEYLNNTPATCYIGFDPTASSLHVGSLIPIMALVHMQRCGHKPIVLVGGGTGLVGDPSGKTEMRKMLTPETVEENASCLKKQLSGFIDFKDDKALLANNTEWLTDLNYISFLRDIGRHFSVNRMIKTESCNIRLNSEEGLSFIEFNYMLLQAYDFLELYDRHACRLQMGGSDQWGNIIAGIELIRRKRQETAFGITFPLITTSSGKKMGKTAKGTVWLDPEKTKPYDYYQFWINTDDSDVLRFMAFFTLLPMNEIRQIEKLHGVDLNTAKTILAFEATEIAHGRQEALKAYYASSMVFGKRVILKNILPTSSIHKSLSEYKEFNEVNTRNHSSDTSLSEVVKGSPDESMPHSYVDMENIKDKISAFKMFHEVGLAVSGSAARRLIKQGGAYINGKRVESVEYLITEEDVEFNRILLRSGKKKFHKVLIKSRVGKKD